MNPIIRHQAQRESYGDHKVPLVAPYNFPCCN